MFEINSNFQSVFVKHTPILMAMLMVCPDVWHSTHIATVVIKTQCSVGKTDFLAWTPNIFMESSKTVYSRSKIMCRIKSFRFNLKSAIYFLPRKSTEHDYLPIFSPRLPPAAVAPVHSGDFKWASTLLPDFRPKAISSTQVTLDWTLKTPRGSMYDHVLNIYLHLYRSCSR